MHETFVSDFIVKYSELERVPDATKLKHPIFREAFALLGMDGHALELASMADIPAGTGLGSSGSFTDCAAQGIARPQEKSGSPRRTRRPGLRNRTGPAQGTHRQTGPIHCGLWRHHLFQVSAGRQGQGMAVETFRSDTRDNLEDNLLLFFTGYSRSASAILKEQDQKSKQADAGMMENLHFVKDLGLQSQRALEAGDLHEFARLDGRALAAQKTAQRRHEQSENQRVV